MANASSMTISAPRLQTNADWVSPTVSYRAGSPAALVDISGWAISGVAVGARGKRIALTTDNGKLVFDGTTGFHVSLIRLDMCELGVGEVEIEIMRATPAPVRPIMRLKGFIERGL